MRNIHNNNKPSLSLKIMTYIEISDFIIGMKKQAKQRSLCTKHQNDLISYQYNCLLAYRVIKSVFTTGNTFSNF